MSDSGVSLRKAYDFLIDRVPPRFSLHYNPNHSLAKKVGSVAAATFLMAAGAISYLAFPQLTFVAFIIGVALHPHVRHLVKSHAQMFWTVTLVCKLALLFFSIPSITYISLIFPFFLGSFMAFHALENPTGEKSYFTASFPKDRIDILAEQVKELTKEIKKVTGSQRMTRSRSAGDVREMTRLDAHG